MAKKQLPLEEEKIFTIALRRKWKPAARVSRTKKSVNVVKQYITKHTRAADVKISAKLNDSLWAGGAKMPLPRIRVKVNVADGVANARLPGEITLEEEKKHFLQSKKKEEAEKMAGKEEVKSEGKLNEPKPEIPAPEEKGRERKGEPKAEEKK